MLDEEFDLLVNRLFRLEQTEALNDGLQLTMMELVDKRKIVHGD